MEFNSLFSCGPISPLLDLLQSWEMAQLLYTYDIQHFYDVIFDILILRKQD